MICLHGQDPGSIAQDGGAGDESGAPLIRRHTHILKQEAACAQPATSNHNLSTAALKAKPRLYCADLHLKDTYRMRKISCACRNAPAACALSLLLSQLSYFGRAESWCAARLLVDYDATQLNCSPGAAAGKESVRVLAADPETWNGWNFKDRKIVPPDPKWNLLAETADLHLERWSDPPGSKWVTYSRPTDCFVPRPAPQPVPPGDAKTDFIVARFVLDVAEGRRPLPLVTETIPLAEEVRRQLGREYGRFVRGRNRGVEFAKDDPRLFSPILYGKDESGNPARSHDHAFYLPTDQVRDGRIDHITIFAAGRFSRDDISALDRLRSLSFGKEGKVDEDNTESGKRRTTHRLLLVGLDSEKPLQIGQFRRYWCGSPQHRTSHSVI